MRKIVIATVILVSFLVASCYWAPETGVGSVRFSLHPDLVSQALINNYDTMRVYLLSASKALLQHDDGLHYREFDLTVTDTVEVDGIPPGNWDVLVSLGTGTSDGYLLVAQYGAGTGVAVTAGSEQDVPVTLSDTPLVISSSLLGEDMSGAVYVGTASLLYASTGNTVYSGTGVNGVNITSWSLASDYTLHGLSKGAFFNAGGSFDSELWLNTDKGIVPYRGALQYSFQQTQINVTESAALADETGAEDNLLVMFQRPKGFGGVSINESDKDDSSLWSWVDVNQLEDTLSSELVLDFSLYGDYVYFASAIGAFKIAKSTIEDDTAEDFIVPANFFTVDSEDWIYSVEVNEATGFMYIGTANGVYRVTIDGATGLPNTDGAVAIPGTEGYGYTAVSVSDSENYAAFLSSYDIFVYNRVTGEVELVPFYAGLPGLLNDFAWNGDTLYLSGTGTDAEGNPTPLGEGGLVSLDVASLF